MNCFNHPDRPAVGVCKACGKALCPDCLTELPEGIACRVHCEERVAAAESARMRPMCCGIRKRSRTLVLGLPLYDIALGPDPAKGEFRGHAHGIIAIGDTARGILAVGGFAFGVLAIGGAAVGCIALGGGAIGVLAFGGGAIGYVAVGGGAIGYYAAGGGALGEHVVSGMRQDPRAVEFFRQWLPFLPGK